MENVEMGKFGNGKGKRHRDRNRHCGQRNGH
jgi:hypothetical protein